MLQYLNHTYVNRSQKKKKKKKIRMHDFPTIWNEIESHYIIELNKQNVN